MLGAAPPVHVDDLDPIDIPLCVGKGLISGQVRASPESPSEGCLLGMDSKNVIAIVHPLRLRLLWLVRYFTLDLAGPGCWNKRMDRVWEWKAACVTPSNSISLAKSRVILRGR